MFTPHGLRRVTCSDSRERSWLERSDLELTVSLPRARLRTHCCPASTARVLHEGGAATAARSATVRIRPSASLAASPARSLRDLVASLRTVTVPGSPATHTNRAYLRELGRR